MEALPTTMAHELSRVPGRSEVADRRSLARPGCRHHRSPAKMRKIVFGA